MTKQAGEQTSVKVVGVVFKPTGKSYDFDAGAFVLSQGDHVIVETEQGLGFGVVSKPPRLMSETPHKKPLKKIFRLATENDFAQAEKMKELEKTAFDFCEEGIKDLKLDMNLFTVEATYDGSKLTFFFMADGRIDFRELVKVLVRHFRVRIELRQIGVRHQAKMCGGIGRCGRETCCTTFMNGFMPVSVKMAKSQNLSLNPTKISGLCGRLMCCLTFENEVYCQLKQGLPKIGKIVDTPSGPGKVQRHSILHGKVSVKLDSGGEAEFKAEDLEKSMQSEDSPDSKPEKKVKAKRKKPNKKNRQNKKKSRDDSENSSQTAQDNK